MTQNLAECYEICRRLNARHGRTYYLATLLLPREKRQYVHALYGFARYADDIVDDLDPRLRPADRATRFGEWGDGFLADLVAGTSRDPITRAVIDTVERWHIPTSYFSDFLASMRMDLTVTEYETYADLASYMWGSAAVIGLEMLPILGRRDSSVSQNELRSAAASLGLAFQLTNFIRDVAEDLRRGRVYIPKDSLCQFGVDRADLVGGRVDDRIRGLLAFEISRARGLYRSAEHGVDLVHPSSQECLRTAIELYEGILNRIERADYDIFRRRAAVPKHARALRYACGLLRARSARRSVSSPSRPSQTQVASVSRIIAKPNSRSSTGA